MFILYLQDKENIYINIEGGDFKKSEYIDFLKPYMHRWRPEYMKARLAKLYLLDAWVKIILYLCQCLLSLLIMIRIMHIEKSEEGIRSKNRGKC